MCVIAVSRAGKRQPTVSEITNAFVNNPHGAGYMYARGGKVHIRKGFMELDDLLDSLAAEQFTTADSVVYHFRISTQAGVNPKMCHPFPVYWDVRAMELLAVKCDVAIAHNGIIHLTSDPNEHRYSDTALFVADFLSDYIRHPEDIHDQSILDDIEELAQSKFALMNGAGEIETIGKFTNDNGILWSNTSYKNRAPFTKYMYACK